MKTIIVGAGLCGSLLAVRLAQRGHNVVMYEKRDDMRKASNDSGRSINLALSARGLMALERVGLKETIAEDCIPMKGRLIHPLGGDNFLSPYSGREEDYINSVSRSGLNILLLNEAEKLSNVEIKFDCNVTDVDLSQGKVNGVDINGNEFNDEADLVIGTDGAGSVVRRSMMSQTTKLLFNYSQDFLRHGYKELSILPADGGGFKIEKNVLHIWPRGHFMIIALPNLDGSFTLTMFHPYEGETGFNTLDTREKVKAMFEKYYSDLLPFIPHYLDEYFENAVGTLGTIKAYPWQAYGKTLIMGDAAHAVVPFYGQGMNASFEDVRVFDDMLDLYGDDYEKILFNFQESRKKNADAIADLAIDNFYEMRDHVDDKAFMLKRKLEMQLEQNYSDYYSKYSLVTFRPELDYNTAMLLGRQQDKLLLGIVEKESSDWNLNDVMSQIKNLHTIYNNESRK
jgi:kynurenine 3-monooxygenase